MTPAVIFDGVSKKFKRGERHDSLRDLVPSLVRRVWTTPVPGELGEEEFWAVRDVSFDVYPGEALGIIGSNGAGKSTTLKLLTRILRPTIGKAEVRGRMGALIEVAAGFHPDLTGRENVFLQGAIMGMKRTEIVAHFDEIVEFAGIAEFIDTPVKRYSSGMNARLGFSVAAHLRPDVLIIDEVLSVGDMAFQEKCYARLQTFLNRGAAVVLVSHNLQAISQLCRRTLMLERGRQVSVGPTAETLARYCNAADPVTERVTNDSVAVQVRTAKDARRETWVVTPGERIELSVEVEVRRSLRRASVGVVVWDLAKNLYVYGVSSETLGIAPIEGPVGHRALFDFAFTANLARGTYVVEVNVYDLESQQTLAVVKPATQFTVAETITYSGIANLFLSGAHVAASVESV